MKGTAIILTVLVLSVCSGALARTTVNTSGERRGPVRLDDADLNAVRSLIEHDIGNVRTTASNYGVWGNPNSTPGFPGWEWPVASGNNFLFSAGLWVGATLNGEHRVSTTVDGDNGTGEFWPLHIGTQPPQSPSADWWSLSYCLDQFNGHFYVRTDTARGYQEYYAAYQDSISIPYVVAPDADYHVPLDIEIEQVSYVWPGYLARDIVFVDYRIWNRGVNSLHNVYIALFADPDIGAAGETGDNASAHDGNFYDPTHLMALQGKYNFWHGAPTPGLFAMKVTGTPVPLNQLRVSFANFNRLQGGDPPVDADKYSLMSSGMIMDTSSQSNDWRFVLSFGALASDGFDLAPDSSLRISVALLSAPNLDSMMVNAGRAQALFDAGYTYRPPSPVRNFHQVSTSAGTVQLSWSPPIIGPVVGYDLFGRDSAGAGQLVHFNSALITDTTYLLQGLQTGEDWKLQLVTVDSNGETSTPAELLVRVGAPSIPTGLQGQMANGIVTLNWNANPEPNITGYRVTRTTVYPRPFAEDSLAYITFETTPPSYQDLTAPRGHDNIYQIQAVNDLGVFSFYSSTVDYIPFAPQHRILVVDQTVSHAGWPSPDSVRTFYERALTNLGEGFDYLANPSNLTVDSLAPYDLVIWHTEYLMGFSASRERALRDYVRAGGRVIRSAIWFTHATIDFYHDGINLGSPATLAPLTFDSFYVSQVPMNHNVMQFVGAAAAQPGFPSVTLDSAKVCSIRWSPTIRYCYLPMVDLLWPNGATHPLYRSVVAAADSSGLGNQPCGVIGERNIDLTFPLYYVRETEADSLLSACIDTLRTMFLDAEPRVSAEPVPTEVMLQPSYPNPFNPTTMLRVDLARTEAVRLVIYDVLGRQVSVLMDGRMEAGRHEVLWNGSAQASGVYFAVLRAGNVTQAQKLVLLK